jgi:hypothetical protein
MILCYLIHIVVDLIIMNEITGEKTKLGNNIFKRFTTFTIFVRKFI